MLKHTYCSTIFTTCDWLACCHCCSNQKLHGNRKKNFNLFVLGLWLYEDLCRIFSIWQTSELSRVLKWRHTYGAVQGPNTECRDLVCAFHLQAVLGWALWSEPLYVCAFGRCFHLTWLAVCKLHFISVFIGMVPATQTHYLAVTSTTSRRLSCRITFVFKDAFYS